MIALPANALRRALPVFAQLPAPRARRLLTVLLGGALSCAAETTPRDALRARHLAASQPAIDALHADLRRQFAYAMHEALRNIDEGERRKAKGDAVMAAEGDPTGGAAADITFDETRLRDGITATVRDHALSAMEEAGAALLRENGFDDPFTMPPQRALDFLEQRTRQLSEIAPEVAQDIRGIISDGLSAGQPRAKTIRQIEEKFGQLAEGRAATIAATEVSAARGVAKFAAMQQLGVTHKEWLVCGLPHIRAAHQAMDGVRLPLAEPFRVAGPDGTIDEILFPCDPDGAPWNIINCRCEALAKWEAA